MNCTGCVVGQVVAGLQSKSEADQGLAWVMAVQLCTKSNRNSLIVNYFAIIDLLT